MTSHLAANKGKPFTIEQIAKEISAEDEVETIFHVLEHLAANPDRGVKRLPGATLFDASYLIP